VSHLKKNVGLDFFDFFLGVGDTHCRHVSYGSAIRYIDN